MKKTDFLTENETSPIHPPVFQHHSGGAYGPGNAPCDALRHPTITFILGAPVRKVDGPRLRQERVILSLWAALSRGPLVNSAAGWASARESDGKSDGSPVLLGRFTYFLVQILVPQ